MTFRTSLQKRMEICEPSLSQVSEWRCPYAMRFLRVVDVSILSGQLTSYVECMAGLHCSNARIRHRSADHQNPSIQAVRKPLSIIPNMTVKWNEFLTGVWQRSLRLVSFDRCELPPPPVLSPTCGMAASHPVPCCVNALYQNSIFALLVTCLA